MKNLFYDSQFLTQKAQLEKIIGTSLTNDEYHALVKDQYRTIKNVNRITNGLEKIDIPFLLQNKVVNTPKKKSLTYDGRVKLDEESSDTSTSLQHDFKLEDSILDTISAQTSISPRNLSLRPALSSSSGFSLGLAPPSNSSSLGPALSSSSGFSFKPLHPSNSSSLRPESSSSNDENLLDTIDNVYIQIEAIKKIPYDQSKVNSMLQSLKNVIKKERRLIKELRTQFNKETPSSIQGLDLPSEKIRQPPTLQLQQPQPQRKRSNSLPLGRSAPYSQEQQPLQLPPQRLQQPQQPQEKTTEPRNKILKPSTEPNPIPNRRRLRN